MKAYTCPRGTVTIQAEDEDSLQAKINLHNDLRHGPTATDPCHAPQSVAPIRRAFRTSDALGITSN